MNDLEQFEQQLQRLAPASLPASLRARLEGIRPPAASPRPAEAPPILAWWRWLFPLGITAAGALLLAVQCVTVPPPVAPEFAGLNADEVQVGQTLVAAFEVVTHLSDGLPVRVRCEHWLDELVLRDSTRGIAVEQSRPRYEVFPVNVETY